MTQTENLYSPEDSDKQEEFIRKLAKRGNELAELNRKPEIKKSAHIFEFLPTIVDTAKMLEPILEELYAHAVSSELSLNPDAKQLKTHVAKLQVTSSIITKGTTRKRDDHTKIIYDFCNDINKAVELILKVMNLDYNEATKTRIDGKENIMLPNFKALVEAHNNIVLLMRSRGHTEFDPKFTKKVTELKGKGVVITASAFATLCLASIAGLLSTSRLVERFDYEPLETTPIIEVVSKGEYKELRITDQNGNPLPSFGSDDLFKIPEGQSFKDINLTPVENPSSLKITNKDGISEVTLTQEVREHQGNGIYKNVIRKEAFLLNPSSLDILESTQPPEIKFFKGGETITISAIPHPRLKDYVQIKAVNSTGEEVSLSGLETNRFISNGPDQKTQLTEFTNPYSPYFYIPFTTTALLGLGGSILTLLAFGNNISLNTVKRPERILSHAEKLEQEMKNNGTISRW